VTSAIAEPIVSSQDSLLACLPPWLENPYRPVSLWDIMVQFSADKVFWSGYALENLRFDCILKPGTGDALFSFAVHGIIEPTREKALDWLEHVQAECLRVGCAVSASTIEDIKRGLASEQRPPEYEWLKNQLEGVQKLIRKELETKTFLYITPEKLRFWPSFQKHFVFGQSVDTAFPSARTDISEAGVCLALSRATGSVFHLMRVLEIGLSALGAVFGISLAHTNWAPAIEQIESKIRDMHKDPTWKTMPDCKEQQEFYAQAASHFGILKDAWRNYTAHARGIYTEERAALIFDNVCEFMKTLATRLHE